MSARIRTFVLACALLGSVLIPAAASASTASAVPGVVRGGQSSPYLGVPTGAHTVNYPTSAGKLAPKRRFTPAQIPQVHAAPGHTNPAPLRAQPARSDTARPPALPPATAVPVHRGAVRPNVTNLIAFPGFTNDVFPGGGPADPSVAAGPGSYLVETVNESMGIFAKTFGVQYSTTLQSWFGTSDNVFDPHTLYDPLSGHFIFVADDNGVNLLVSVSTTSDPFGGWCNFSLDARNAAGQFADYPMIGLDTRNLYVTFNEFNGAQTAFVGNRLIAIDRAAAESCKSPGVFTFSNLGDPGAGDLSSSIVPATNDHTLEPQAFFINNYPGYGSNITSRYLDQNNVLNSYQVAVPSYSTPVPAPQKGSTGRLDPGDGRIFQAIQYNFGLFAAFSTQCTAGGATVDCVEWLKINDGPYPPSLIQSGLFGAAGYFYIYPAMGQASDGTAMITSSVTGPGIWTGVTDVSINLDGAITGDLYLLDNSNGVAYTGAKSNACSNCYRWGDFSSAYNDPTNMNQFWVADEITGDGTANWDTVLGHVGE